ncbi:PQQ-binding-like beta-propeller repeat protein [Actinoplanes sp. NPDC049265]|uniref:outer membrane protein assembly factor BamB family protein n=1 Tax=Actinoplanes sp. NPDC049265 TaxID=3363902 RepID=UPI00371F107F
MSKVIRAAGLALLLALAGCDDSHAASPAPAASPAANSPSDSPAPSAPAPSGTQPASGTQLATFGGDGRLTAVSNVHNDGFVVVDSLLSAGAEQSTLQVYDRSGHPLAQLPAGSFTGECGAADVLTTRGRLIVTELATQKPAEGIAKATNALTLTATDAATGSTVWTADVVTKSEDPLLCQAFDGELWNFSATLDGRWGALLWDSGDTSIAVAVDLATGKLHPRKDLMGTLGSFLVTGSKDAATLTTPDGWARLGRLKTDGSSGGSVPLDGPGEYAPTGQLANRGFSNPPRMEVTPDGSVLAGVLESNDGSDSHIDGYALPSMRRLWRVPTAGSSTDTVAGINGNILLINRETNGASGGALLALDVHTGKKLWSIDVDGGTVCDVTGSQVLVNTHDQLATLSTATGEQLSFADNPYRDPATGVTDCPHTLEGALGGVGLGDGTVVQLLQP